MMTTQARQRAVDAASFTARVFVVGGPPDGDGDVILDDNDGMKVRVSLTDHDTLLDPTMEPAGDAVLHRTGNAVVADGVIYATPRGRQLRAKLVENGPAQEWSCGYVVNASRSPTAKQLEQWPDARRIITTWTVEEISPVRRGACGPTCRTTSAKCAGGRCAYAPRKAPGMSAGDRAALEREIKDFQQRDADIRAGRPPGLQEQPSYMVESWIRDLADSALEAARHDLGLNPELRVRWFKAHAHPRIRGLFCAALPDAIWLRSDLKGPAVVRTVGHECRHAAAAQRGDPSSETQAKAYGERLMRSDRQGWPHCVRAPWYDEHGERL